MVKKLKHQFSDELLFRQEMDGVAPLKTPPTTDSKVPRASKRKYRPETLPADITPAFSPSEDNQTHIDSDDGSSHRKNGVQKRLIQRLKRGYFPVDDQLDLHHMTTVMGHTALLKFIADSQGERLKCVRIIHGKGLRSDSGPRLKIMTRHILRDHPQVLAFTACKPADGGSGAMVVLLKSL